MQVRAYLTVLSRWWWRLLLGALLAGGVAYFATRSQPSVYRATTTLFVNYTAGPGTITYSDALLNQSLVKTYSQMVNQPVVLEKVRERLGLPYDLGALRRLVAVRPVRDTQLLEISVEGTSPAETRDIANAVAAVFIEEQAPYLPTEPTGTSLRVAQPALLPPEPIGPRLLLNTGLGAVLGALITLGLLALFEYLNDSVGTAERVMNAAGLLVLATVPTVPDLRHAFQRPEARNGVHGAQPASSRHTGGYQSTIEEAFRVLRANLRLSALEHPLRSLLITSAGPGEGKTTTAANLAIVLAQGGQRVILVDADLRRPELHSRFRVRNREGLTTLLLDDESLRPAILQPTAVENLRLLTSGPPLPNSSELLASKRLEQRLAELGEQADILVIDSPPTLAVSDPVVLAQAVDAVLLVADAQATRGSHLDQARAAIEQAGGRVLGVSLNKIRERRDGYYGYKPYGRPRPAPEADALDDAPRAEEPRGADAAPVARATRRTALIVGAALGGVAAVGLFAALASQVVGFGPDAAPPPDATAPPAASVSTSSNEVETPAPILGALTEAGVPDSLPPATSGAGAPETLQPSPASANEPRTVLDERFTDNQRSWPSNAEGTAWHADGAYRLFARDRARFVAIGAPVGESLRDVVVTATLRKVGGPPGGRYGIIVRDQGPSPRDGNNQVGQFYVFVVNDRGELGIWRREGDRWIDLVASNPSPAVQRDAATNVLTVQAVGRRLTFVVNGIEVADVTDAVLAEGGVGVYASGDLNDVVVERFVVQEPPSPRADASASEAEPPAREPQMARATIQVPGGFTTVLLREGPSTSARSLSALPNGMPVDIAEETAEGDGFRWVRARTSDGLVGWIVSTAVAL